MGITVKNIDWQDEKRIAKELVDAGFIEAVQYIEH